MALPDAGLAAALGACLAPQPLEGGTKHRCPYAACASEAACAADAACEACIAVLASHLQNSAAQRMNCNIMTRLSLTDSCVQEHDTTA